MDKPASPQRHLVALLWAALLAGPSAVAGERIVDARTGQTLSRDALIEVIADSDFLLLGELHDNPLHHKRRGELLAALPETTTVVAEHLQLGKQMAPSGALLNSLEDAGFDAKAWRWPLHGPLFAAIRERGLPLAGGNIPRATARAVVRDGGGAIPTELSEIVAGSPLAAASQASLDAELLRSHCAQVPAAMIPGLRLAQQTRDAAMFSALSIAVGRPAVLLAGNGHIRSDYGVPRLLRQHRPNSRLIAVAFLEEGAATAPDEQATPYDYLWITEAASRADPCADFKRPAA